MNRKLFEGAACSLSSVSGSSSTDGSFSSRQKLFVALPAELLASIL
jgi:hypothetical protein